MFSGCNQWNTIWTSLGKETPVKVHNLQRNLGTQSWEEAVSMVFQQSQRIDACFIWSSAIDNGAQLHFLAVSCSYS